MYRLTLVFLLLLAMCAAAGSAADWPQFRGPNFDGISPEKGINKNWNQKPPKLLWKTEMSDDGYAGPSVANKVVYIIDHKGANDIVRGISLTTGKDVWTYTYEDSRSANYGFSRATPTIDNGKIYIVSMMGLVGCMDLKTEKGIWGGYLTKNLNGRKPTWDYAMSPLIDGNKIIVVPGAPDGCVVALDKRNGTMLWKGGSDGAGYSTPVKAKIQGKEMYVVFSATGVGGYDVNNGKRYWFVGWKTDNDVNSAQPIIIGNSVFISSGYGKGCALIDVANDMSTKIRWQNKAIQAHFNSAVLMGGYIYGIGDPDNLVCLDPKTGDIMWSQRGFEKGPVIGVDGVLLALGGSSGALAMVSPTPSGYKELGRFTPLGGQSWTAPVVSDGKLIVRNKKTLACFDLK